MAIGIICEFNPFHEGHKYLIDTVKKYGDKVVCVMSGNTVQRGELSVYEKFDRAETAVRNGADLVIELPCVYSCASSERFAQNGVRLLEACGVIDKLAFGAECDDKNELYSLSREIKAHNAEIGTEMKKGISYPIARKNVIKSDLLDHPNNILALEYLACTSLDFIPVRRIGAGHDSEDIKYSASAIRKSLSCDEICSLKNCEKAVLYKLRTMSEEDFRQIDDVSEGLENRIIDAVKTAKSLDELYELIKTKRYTHSRIRRIILRAYLGITKDYDFDAPYIRVLAFDEKGKKLLAEMRNKASLPIVSRYADISSLDENSKRLFELECKVTDIYNLGYTKILPCSSEQRSKIRYIKESDKE